MKRSARNVIAILAIATFGMAVSEASAGVIISPVSATIDAGGPGFGSINDTLNQNGLFTNFVSGVTDFDTYLAGNPIHSLIFAGNEWFSEVGLSGATVTYDLGSLQTIDALALWNEDASGIGTLDLFGSTDGVNFSPLASNLSPTNNPVNFDYPADVFPFAAATVRFVRFVITNSPQPDDPQLFDGAAIGEVAFRVAEIPEPTTLALCGLIGVGLAGYRLRRRRVLA